jgi:hypothetical protein
LRAEDFLPGAGEAAEFGDFHEGDELVKVHGCGIITDGGVAVASFKIYRSKVKSFNRRDRRAILEIAEKILSWRCLVVRRACHCKLHELRSF